MNLDFNGIEIPAEAQAKLNEQVGGFVQKAVEAEVSGLKNKNNELLGNLTGMKEKLKAWDGLDPEKVRSTLSQLDKDKDLQMLKDGKLDELVDKRVADVQTKFDEQVKGLNTQLEGLTKERDDFKARYQRNTVGQIMGKLALESKAMTTALDDITRRALDVFTVTENGELEARDAKGNLMKTADGDLLTPARFIESLKKDAPHYWPASQGGGLGGDGGAGGSDIDAAMEKAASAGDMDTYQRLRKIKEKGADGKK